MPIETATTPSPAVAIAPASANCPWKRPEVFVASTSFRELMDSDFAAKLQTEEDEKYAHDLRYGLFRDEIMHIRMFLVCRWKTRSKLKSLSPLDMTIFLQNSSHQKSVMIMIIFLHWCFNMSTTMNSMGWWKSTKPRWTAIAKVDLSNLIVESLHVVPYLVKLSMKNFMLLPAARPEQSAAEVPEDIETEMPTETFSDCEQGTPCS